MFSMKQPPVAGIRDLIIMGLALYQTRIAIQVGQDHGLRFVHNDGNPGSSKRELDVLHASAPHALDVFTAKVVQST